MSQTLGSILRKDGLAPLLTIFVRSEGDNVEIPKAHK